ncbi:MAG: DUF1616 domain-containing protein [Methanosarcinales archaeon]|nr:DUF1616 domain-containing protein [Methanosarcinales archaeon]
MNKLKNILNFFPIDLKIISIYILFTLVFLIVPPFNETFIRIILGIPMVIFIPGYVLIIALFPKKTDLCSIERLGLSIGLSTTIVPLIGLILNFTPWRIRFWPIVTSLILFTFLLMLVALKRRLGIPEDMRFAIQSKEIYFNIKNEIFSSKNKIDKILTIILAISIITASIVLVYVILFPRQGETFTEFYILGPEGMAIDFPEEVGTSKPINIIIGVINNEHSTLNYTIQARINDTIYFEEKIQLSHNEKWENPVNFKINTTGDNLKLEFLLFKENNLTPHRNLHLWIDPI